MEGGVAGFQGAGPVAFEGSRGAVVGVCAIDLNGTRIDISPRSKRAVREMHHKNFLGTEIVPRWGAAWCAPTIASVEIWSWAAG